MAAGSLPTLAAAHLRLGRAAVGIYVAASAVALSLLGAFLFTEQAHAEAELRRQVLVQSADRAHALQNHLELLTRELRRLGLRSEVDLFDQNTEPERSLLGISHGGSTFFNLGVGILRADGAVVWAEPKRFLAAGQSFAKEPWFAGLSGTRALRIVAVTPERTEDSTLYVVSPIIRSDQFQGAIVGGIDLATSHTLSIQDRSIVGAATLLTTLDGRVVFPARPPAFAAGPTWQRLFGQGGAGGKLSEIAVDGRRNVLAMTPIEGTELKLLLLVDEGTLFQAARERLQTRLAAGLALALVPLFALIALLRHSLRIFRQGEELAMREERLQRVGEAANLIAHEVKNSLNGIRMAAELAVGPSQPEGRAGRALTELRGEIERLSNFTGDLMAFSKGIKPRPARLDLNELARKLTLLFEAKAAEENLQLHVEPAPQPVWVSADPQLLRVALSNLVNNAFDALSARQATSEPPRVDLRVWQDASAVGVSVADNADGVPEHVRPRLFEPFQSGKANGVGIGLALGKRIALAHGGDLTLEESSHGAIFRLTLPWERS